MEASKTARLSFDTVTPLTRLCENGRLPERSFCQSPQALARSDRQRDFLDFVLAQYAVVGESKLDDGKLPALLELRYGTSTDAVRELGAVAEIRATVLGLQRGLYKRDGRSWQFLNRAAELQRGMTSTKTAVPPLAPCVIPFLCGEHNIMSDEKWRSEKA